MNRLSCEDAEMMTADSFREVLARVPTAVSVITTTDLAGQAWGVTVGSLGSLSLTPPLVLFCLDRANESHDVVTAAGRFLVHVLTDHQADVASCFARRGGHDFGSGHQVRYGLPAIPGPLALLACRRDALIRAGDHTIVTGLVEAAEVRAGRPLVYHERRYCALSEQEPLAAAALSRSRPTGGS